MQKTESGFRLFHLIHPEKSVFPNQGTGMQMIAAFNDTLQHIFRTIRIYDKLLCQAQGLTFQNRFSALIVRV